MSQVALDANVPLIRPERIGDPAVVEELAEHAADLGVVAAFGQFLPKRVREMPTLGYLINAHASLLPRHRGAAPIAHAILAGDSHTGISVMRIEREMDAGPVARVDETPIGDDETTEELTGRLAAMAAHSIDAVVEEIAGGVVSFREQDASQATHAPKIEREHGRIDWSENAVSIARLVRAMAPRPGATTSLDGQPLRILAGESVTRPVNDPNAAPAPEAEQPGTVRCDGRTLLVATGQGWLQIHRLQRSGAAAMETGAFLRGKPISDGARLG